MRRNNQRHQKCREKTEWKFPQSAHRLPILEPELKRAEDNKNDVFANSARIAPTIANARTATTMSPQPADLANAQDNWLF
jgi:hypothetical protein